MPYVFTRNLYIAKPIHRHAYVFMLVFVRQLSQKIDKLQYVTKDNTPSYVYVPQCYDILLEPTTCNLPIIEFPAYYLNNYLLMQISRQRIPNTKPQKYTPKTPTGTIRLSVVKNRSIDLSGWNETLPGALGPCPGARTSGKNRELILTVGVSGSWLGPWWWWAELRAGS